MQPSNFEDTLEQTTQELIEQLVELLLNIANEVLLNRPLCIKRFLADYLVSKINKKTLWHMQMEGFLNDNAIKSPNAFNEYKGCCHSNVANRESCFHAKESYLSHLLQRKTAMEREAYDDENLKDVMSATSDDRRPTNYYESEVNDFRLGNNDGREIIDDRDISFLLKELTNGIESMSKRCADDKLSSSTVDVNNQIYVGSSKVTELKNYFLSDSSSRISKHKNKEDVPIKNNSDEGTVYDKVTSSINMLIGIEKDFKKCGSEYGVYKYLKKKRENKNDASDVEATGIVECSCLKPSLFRKIPGKKILNSDKRLTNQFKINNPIEDLSNNTTSFVITGRPIHQSSEMKDLNSMASANFWKHQVGGSASLEKEHSVMSDNSSTSISSAYEYNKHIASSSTECLLGHLMRHKKDLPSTRSSASPKSSSLSSDKDVISASNESKQETKTISKEEDIRAPNGDTRGKHMGKEGSINTKLLTKDHEFASDIKDVFQLRETPSSLNHISLYRCPEQCDFFKTEDLYSSIPYRFAEPLGARNTCEKKLKKNLSDTDARMPDWAEYCLGLPPLSVSAHLLNPIKDHIREKIPSSEALEFFPSECSPNSSNIRYLAGESSTLYNGAAMDPHKSFLYCLSRKPFNKTDISISKGETSFNSEGTELILSQDRKARCSELRSLPCPSLYYHTTWLDSNCSLEASEDSSQWRRTCNENRDNNSSKHLGISQGWISIDDIFSGCTLFQNDDILSPGGNNNHALECKEIVDLQPRPCQRNHSTRDRRSIPGKEQRNLSLNSSESETRMHDYIYTSLHSTPKPQFNCIKPLHSKQTGSNYPPSKEIDTRDENTSIARQCPGKTYVSLSQHDLHPFSMWHTFNVFDGTQSSGTRKISTDDANSGEDLLLLYETDL